MNTLVIVLIAAVCLIAAYALYGRWLAKKWGIDPKAKTPAVLHNDGQDYVPTDGWTVLSDPGGGVRMAAGPSVDHPGRHLLRSGDRLWRPVCQCEERRQIHGAAD